MEYIVKTKFEKGDVVYAVDQWRCPILRLLIIGVSFRKNFQYPETYVEYLCLPCNKDGKIGEGFDSGTYVEKYGRHAKDFREFELYSSLDDMLSHTNENLSMSECCIDDSSDLYTIAEIEGETKLF